MFAPFWHWVGRRRTRPVVWPPACYPAVSIPYFYSAHPQRALPLKGGGSYSQLCLSIPRWSFKRAHSPAERERERDSKKGETAEIEIVWGVMELDRSQSIQPKIPQPIETSCPCYRFPPRQFVDCLHLLAGVLQPQLHLCKPLSPIVGVE